MYEPYGIMLLLKVIPVFASISFISDVLEITILTSMPSWSLESTVFKSSISATPSNFAKILFSSEIFPAIPPT